VQEAETILTRQPVRKSSTGLDLTNLYVGSEGTLGVIVELLVKVHPLLNGRSGGMITFHTTEDAVRTVVQLRTRHTLSMLTRCELINAEAVRAGNQLFGTTLECVPTLLLEFNAPTSEAKDFALMRADFEVILGLAKQHGNCKQDRYFEDASTFDQVCVFAVLCV
jgi:D-lactate dehydrogenase (cytochrome)